MSNSQYRDIVKL